MGGFVVSAVNDAWNGKVAVVTGGGSGIGEATAELFVRQGGAVALIDANGEAARSVAGRINGRGGRAVALEADIVDAASMASAAKQVADALGRVDVLANIAGILRRHASLADWPVEEFRRVIEVNLTGMFVVTRAFAPALAKSGGGAIVNIASVAALNATPTTPAYSASKAGVLGLTRTLAAMLKAEGIRVNAILPDHVDTPMMKDSPVRNTKPTLAANDVAQAVLYAAGRADLTGAFLRIRQTDAGPCLERVEDPPAFQPVTGAPF